MYRRTSKTYVRSINVRFERTFGIKTYVLNVRLKCTYVCVPATLMCACSSPTHGICTELEEWRARETRKSRVLFSLLKLISIQESGEPDKSRGHHFEYSRVIHCVFYLYSSLNIFVMELSDSLAHVSSQIEPITKLYGTWTVDHHKAV